VSAEYAPPSEVRGAEAGPVTMAPKTRGLAELVIELYTAGGRSMPNPHAERRAGTCEPRNTRRGKVHASHSAFFRGRAVAGGSPTYGGTSSMPRILSVPRVLAVQLTMVEVAGGLRQIDRHVRILGLEDLLRLGYSVRRRIRVEHVMPEV